jgi:hypothetical protein
VESPGPELQSAPQMFATFQNLDPIENLQNGGHNYFEENKKQ